MQYLKGKIAAFIMGTPAVLFLSCVYGPVHYYSCQNDDHCRQFPNGKCEIQKGKDSAGAKGGYCEYEGYTRCPSGTVVEDEVIKYVPKGEKCPDESNVNPGSDSNSDA